MGHTLGEGHVAAMAEGLRDISAAFAEEIKRRPTIGELLEILTWAIRSCPEDTLSDVHPANITALRVHTGKGRAKAPPDPGIAGTPSAVGELNDNVFSLSADLLCSVARALKAENGHAPTLDDMAKLIAESLHRSGEDVLSDVKPRAITRIQANVRKRGKNVARPGDIVAIPARNGEHFPAVVLDKNAFGTAYGLFEGTRPLRPITASSHPKSAGHVYSGDELVAEGRWRVVGHDEKLRALFPPEPEIYHRSQIVPGGPKVGPYGSGETASGAMRDVTKEEAEKLGLLTGDYRQTYTPEELEQYLERELGGRSR